MHKGQDFSVLRLTATFAVFAILAGCASTPDVYSNQDPSADFANYRTYNFERPLGTDKPGTQSTSLVSKYLMNAVSREMESRGYKKSDDPNLLINFYIHTQEKIRTTQTPTTGGYYGYRGNRYNTWGGYGGTETQVTQYTEGTLNVDLVEVKRGQLVWEGVLVGRMSDDVLENLEAKANSAIKTLFENYPYIAGSNAAQPAANK
jgi:hypothetical protein